MANLTSVLESSILTLINKAIEKAGYDRTRTGRVQAINENGTYRVLIDGVVYPSVPILNTYTADVGDTVKVKYPSGNVSQMYICNGTDNGWKEVTTIGNEFTYYSADTHPKFRKSGHIVSLQGDLTPIATIAGSVDHHTLFELPEGYRPNSRIVTIMQGSGTYMWEMSIHPDGRVTFARYRNSSSFSNCTNGSWLPVTYTFLI